MVANMQQPAPAKEQPQMESKPVVPVTVPPQQQQPQEQTKVDNKTKQQQHQPQSADKVHSVESVTKR